MNNQKQIDTISIGALVMYVLLIFTVPFAIAACTENDKVIMHDQGWRDTAITHIKTKIDSIEAIDDSMMRAIPKVTVSNSNNTKVTFVLPEEAGEADMTDRFYIVAKDSNATGITYWLGFTGN